MGDHKMTSEVAENVEYRGTQLSSQAPRGSKAKPLLGKKSESIAKSSFPSRKLKHDYKHHHKYPPPRPHYRGSPYYYHPYYYPYIPNPRWYHHHHWPSASVYNNKSSSSKPKREPSTTSATPPSNANTKSTPPETDGFHNPAKKQCSRAKRSDNVVSSKKNADEELGRKNGSVGQEIHKESTTVISKRIADPLDVEKPICDDPKSDNNESPYAYDAMDPLDLKLMSSAKFVTFKHIGEGLDDNGHCLQKNKADPNIYSLQCKELGIVQSNEVDHIIEDTNLPLPVNDPIETDDSGIDILFHTIEFDEKETTQPIQDNHAVYDLDGSFRISSMEGGGREASAEHHERIYSLKHTETNMIGGDDDDDDDDGINDNYHFDAFICSLKSEDEEHSLIRHPGAFSPIQWLKI